MQEFQRGEMKGHLEYINSFVICNVSFKLICLHVPPICEQIVCITFHLIEWHACNVIMYKTIQYFYDDSSICISNCILFISLFFI